MKIKAVIFDMDGTIIHSHGIWNNIIASLVGEQNIHHFFNLRHKATGKGMEKTCHVLKHAFNLSGSMEDIAHIYESRVQHFFTKHSIDFVDGFKKFHQHLATNNIITGLATDAPNHALDIVRKKLNLSALFGDHIYNSCMIQSVFKPNPAIFSHTLEKIGVSWQECVIFEDSVEGINAAKKLDIFCIGIARDNNHNEILSADLIINDYTKLTLDSLNQYFQQTTLNKQAAQDHSLSSKL